MEGRKEMEMDPQPTLRLVMEKGPSEGQTLEFLPRTRIRIGRIARGNNVTIKDLGISTKHLAINFQVQSGRTGGFWSVSDLGSSNGTVLNSDSLEPFAPARLSDGDIIKIGECTSIRVGFKVAGEEGSKRGRGRHRRDGKVGLPVADEDSELGLGEIEKNEDLRGKEVLESSEISEQMRSLLPGLDGRSENVKMLGKKVREKWTKSKKKEDILVEKNGADENIEETENVVEKLRPRRGRPAKKEDTSGLVSANFNQNGVLQGLKRNTRSLRNKEMFEVSENSIQNGVERILGEQGQEEVSKRVTRSVKKAVDLAENATIRRTTRSAGKEGIVEELVQDVGMGKQIKRRAARAKKDLIQNVKDSEVAKEVEMVEEKLGLLEKETKEMKEDLMVEEMFEREESGVVDGLVEKEVVNSGIDGSGTLASASGINADNLNVLDLEKITLGEWLDYLEDYLPKHIIDTTEEMILDMRQKAQKFHEFLLQQKNSKEMVGVPVG